MLEVKCIVRISVKTLHMYWSYQPAHMDMLLFVYQHCETVNNADETYSSPVKKMLGAVPSAVQQGATRGHAEVLKQTGEASEAEALLQSLVKQQQKEQLQHELCADYGMLLHKQGNLKVEHHRVIGGQSLLSKGACYQTCSPLSKLCQFAVVAIKGVANLCKVCAKLQPTNSCETGSQQR